jgi:DNA polymerase delta subunit 4
MEIKDFFKSKKTSHTPLSNVSKDTKPSRLQQRQTFKTICSDLMLSAEMPPKKKTQQLPSLSEKTESQIEQITYELKQFDLNGRYGPVAGMTRMERWQRAFELGKNPPAAIKAYLEDEELQKLIPTINNHLWYGIIDLKLPLR